MIEVRLELEDEYTKYSTYKEFRLKVEEALVGSMYEDIFQYIERVKDSSKKVIYIHSLHAFGKQDGTAIYRKIKAVI